MTIAVSLIGFKLLLCTGLAVWLAVVNVSNIIAFHSGAAAIGYMMKMGPLDEPPKIDTPLLSRRVMGAGWHKLVFAILIAIEFSVAVLFANAAVRLCLSLSDTSLIEASIVHANVAFTSLLFFGFVMLMGGTWFAYYIRQESHQITHMCLLVLTVAGMVVVNLR